MSWMTCTRRQARRAAAAVTTAVVMMMLAGGTVARADPTVTIVPPAGFITTTDPAAEQGRTVDPNPTFLIEGTWTTIECSFNGRTVDCGSAVTPCPQGQCLALSLHGLDNGQDGLRVDAWDAEGYTYAFYEFDVDLTPPRTVYDIASPTPTQPAFDVGYQEDDDFADDTLQCSFTPASAPPSWTSCGYADTYEPPPLPPEDVRYLFRARTIDDFGRSANTVTVPYDPKPCTIGPIRPLRTLPFEVHGVPYRLSCWGSVDVALGLYVLGQDGHRHPFAYVFKHDASVGGTGTLRTVDRRGRLLLYPNGSLDIALRQDRSATLAVYADPDIGMGGNSIEGLPTIRVFTIRR